ncbi:hypothetical protein [Nesterenkonia pannonica]|uniref:hypothetical protein n=1 Tax=Nesterenkonia pannonica TaxID=1548602 RepID=UPI0021646FD6|nr:hypothetical protein [Nesterenkonia pannonica]
MSSATAMPALSPAVAEIEQTSECLDYEQTLDGEGVEAEPAPLPNRRSAPRPMRRGALRRSS